LRTSSGSRRRVVAIEFDEVESIEEYALVRALVADELERGNAAVIASHRFAIDDAGARAQARQRFDDQREAVGEVIAGAAVEPHALAILAGNDAEAVVLNLMQPRPAGWQLIGFGGEARRDEPGREATLQHATK
jgi:glucose-6-phosphate dehydrogenase assembly protein OpcA